MTLLSEINQLCLRQLGRLPNIENPTGYNDKIQWLKLHDQRLSQIAACDKIKARSLVPVENQIPFVDASRPESYPLMVKTNHDSGGSRIARNAFEYRAAMSVLGKRLSSPYGTDKGEWAYRYIEPKIFCEKYTPEASVDYKFHCVNGRVAWVQVIWDRASGKPKEAIFMPDGTIADLHMDEKMVHTPNQHRHPGTEAWAKMTSLAETLAAPYRYVRVDLYWAGIPLFGELTFWPRAGCYKSKDEPIFGDILDIDTSYRLDPVHPLTGNAPC